MFSTMLYVTFASYIKPNSVKLIKYVKKLRTYSEPRLASWVLNFLIILSLISWFYVKSSRIMEHVQGLMPWLTRGTHLTQLARWFLPHLCPAFGTSPISALWWLLSSARVTTGCISGGAPVWAILPHPRWGPGHGPGEDRHQSVPLESLIRARWWLSAPRAGSATVC